MAKSQVKSVLKFTNENWSLIAMEVQQSFLLVVIVNYKTAPYTIKCLESLESEVKQIPGTRVVVVDNDSRDNSVAEINQAIASHNWQEWANLIPSERNGGYAYGNNVAIRPALESEHPPEYVLLLNPDTLIRPQAISKLIEFMQQHPEVGITGSRLEDEDATPQRSAFRFHSIWSEFERGLRLGIVSKLLSRRIIAPPVSETACQTDWVAGASMMIRREVFKAVGLLDEEYFMYYEEVDFCLKANKAGWLCWYVPESRVVHYVGQSSGVTNTKVVPKRRPQYWFESRERYFIKNYGRFYTFWADLMWMTGFNLWRLRNLVQQKPVMDPPYLFVDFLRNSILAQPGKTIRQS